MSIPSEEQMKKYRSHEYIMIRTGSDGMSITPMNQEDLDYWLQEEAKYVMPDVDNFNRIPSPDPMYWGESITLIKGKVIKIRPQETVVSWAADKTES